MDVSQEKKPEVPLNEMQRQFGVILRKFFKVPNEVFFKAAYAEIEVFKKCSKENLKAETPAALVREIYQVLSKFELSLQSQQSLAEGSVEVFKTGTQFVEASVPNTWQYRTFVFLQKNLGGEFGKYIHAGILHGSYGSLDSISQWSDADIILILSGAVFETDQDLMLVKSHLQKLALLCYKIDPLAHHEFIFITQFDLGYYARAFFPPETFARGLLLVGAESIQFRFRDDYEQRVIDLKKIVQYFQKKVESNSFSTDKYAWKNDVAHMLIWPIRMLQMKGEYMYKRESFQEISKQFPTLVLDPIKTATEIMHRWKRLNLLKFYPSFLLLALPYWLNRKIFGAHVLFSRRAKPEQTTDEIATATRNFLRLAQDGMKFFKTHE